MGRGDRPFERIRDGYAVRKKPHELALNRDQLVPFVPMESLAQDGTFDVQYSIRSLSDIRSSTFFERGDLLIAKITPCFENGKQAIANAIPTEFGFATTEVIPLYPVDDNHDARFLFYILLHPSIRASIAERMEGSTARQRVPVDILLDLQYPYFAGDEQRRIADALSAVRSAIALESDCARTWKRTKSIALNELFTSGLRRERQTQAEIGRIPESWQRARIGDHFAVVSGGTPSRANANYWRHGTIPWIKTTEINYGIITHADEHITELGLSKSAAKMLARGTILMAMYGQGVTRGKVAMLGIEAACNQACAAMVPLDEAVNPSYLFHFLTYRYEEIRRLAHGGQQQNLNLDIVRDLPIVYSTDATEQMEIVEIVDAVDQKIGLHSRKKAVLEDLFKALLDAVLTGDVRVSDLDLAAVDEAVEGQEMARVPKEAAV